MEKLVRTIRAQGADGAVVTINEYQEYIDTTSISDTSTQWTPGLKRLQLSNGGAVNFVNETTFEIVATGEVVTAI